MHSLWPWLLLGGVVAFATKLAGYLVPAHWLEKPAVAAAAGRLTIGLLAALTVMNTLASGQQLAIDARIGALLVAALALWARLPFLLVVVLGAAAAAALRWVGIG